MWQVASRSDGDLRVQESLDTYYIRNWSLWLDLHIGVAKWLGSVFAAGVTGVSRDLFHARRERIQFDWVFRMRASTASGNQIKAVAVHLRRRGREDASRRWSRRRLRMSASYLSPQDKPRPLASKHLEWRHALDTEADACVGYLDLARRRRGNFVGDDRPLDADSEATSDLAKRRHLLESKEPERLGEGRSSLQGADDQSACEPFACTSAEC